MGGAAIDIGGDPLPDSTLALAAESDVVLMLGTPSPETVSTKPDQVETHLA